MDSKKIDKLCSAGSENWTESDIKNIVEMMKEQIPNKPISLESVLKYYEQETNGFTVDDFAYVTPNELYETFFSSDILHPMDAIDCAEPAKARSERMAELIKEVQRIANKSNRTYYETKNLRRVMGNFDDYREWNHTYVISDIHGRYDKYMEMLEKINFSINDRLFFLGDALDRGPDGIKILLDMMSRPNVFPILGNHEAMALDALPTLEAIREIYNGKTAGGTTVTDEEVKNIRKWRRNHCKPSLKAFMKLKKDDREAVMDYMRSMPLYQKVEVGGRSFLLVHGGFDNFSPERPLYDYSCDEIVWARPKTYTRYFDDRTVILGHTPIFYLIGSTEKTKAGRIFHGDGFIDIDCGCVYGYTLGCLCLDNMKEFYV